MSYQERVPSTASTFIAIKVHLVLVSILLTSWPGFAWATILTFDGDATLDWQSGVTGRGQARWDIIYFPQGCVVGVWGRGRLSQLPYSRLEHSVPLRFATGIPRL